MHTQAEYEKWHLHNEHVPRILPSLVWARKMEFLEAIEERLANIPSNDPEWERLDSISNDLCRELGL